MKGMDPLGRGRIFMVSDFPELRRLAMAVRSWAIGVCCAAAAVVLAACGGGEESDDATARNTSAVGTVTGEVVRATTDVELVKSDRPYVIGIALPHLRDPYWVNLAYGVFDQAEKAGAGEVRLVAAGGYANVQEQLNQIENFVQQGVDGIILAAVDFEATKLPAEAALAAGTPVVTAGSPTNSERVAWVLIDDAELGALQADFIAGELSGGGTVATLNGPAAASWTKARADGFKMRLQENNAQIQIVAERNSELDRGEATNITDDLVQRFRDLDFITCVADFLCKGTVDALRAAGRKGQPRISTATWNRDTEVMLREGFIDFIVGERPTLAGRLALNVLVRQLNGEDVPRITTVPVEGYTRDNIDEVDLALETAPEGWTPPR